MNINAINLWPPHFITRLIFFLLDSQVIMLSVELNVNLCIQYDCWLGFPKNSFRNWRNIFFFLCCAACHFSNGKLSEVFTSVNVLIIDMKICQAAFNQCRCDWQIFLNIWLMTFFYVDFFRNFCGVSKILLLFGYFWRYLVNNWDWSEIWTLFWATSWVRTRIQDLDAH